MTTAAQTAKTFRPIIPAAILAPFAEMFAASHDLERFVEKTLLCPDSVLYNPDHEHLIGAAIGYLWTNVPNTRQQKAVAATAEMPKPPQAGRFAGVVYEHTRTNSRN